MTSADDKPDTPAPRANPHLVGCDAAEARLLDAWRSGRLPHAWLFTGPRGIGKATLAFRFARFVLAQGTAQTRDAVSLAIEPQSGVFRRVASGGHADLLTVERGWDDKRERWRSEIRIDETRTIADFLHLTPGEGGWRVVVVDGADDMNRSAANAILKILEEPPPQALLLLASHAPGRLLPTIRSRCRRLSLSPLEDRQIVALLGRHRPDVAGADVDLLVRLAEGSIGRAIELADAGGVELYRDVGRLLLSLPAVDVAALHGLGDRLARTEGESTFRAAGEILLGWLARMIRAGAAGASPIELMPGETACMERLLAVCSVDRWVDLWDRIARLFAASEDVYLDRKQVWTSTILDIENLARR